MIIFSNIHKQVRSDPLHSQLDHWTILEIERSFTCDLCHNKNILIMLLSQFNHIVSILYMYKYVYYMRLCGIPVQYTYNSHVRHGWIRVLYVTAYNNIRIVYVFIHININIKKYFPG